jgi:predicted PurR-regulated permease PerM
MANKNNGQPFWANLFKRWYVWLPSLIVIALIFILLPRVLVYLLSSFVISLILSPIKNLFLKIKIKKFHISASIATLLSMVIFFGVIIIFFAYVMPPIINNLSALLTIDYDNLLLQLQSNLKPLEDTLKYYKIANENFSIIQIIQSYISQFQSSINIEDTFANIINSFGDIIIGVITVIFFSFFIVKDQNVFPSLVKSLFAERYHVIVDNIINDTRILLSRYFLGILIDQIIVFILMFFVFTLIGYDYAILIAFFAGLFNIIPYFGPLIALIIAILLGIVSTLTAGADTQLIWTIVITIIGFESVKALDNFILQPNIYARSVKSTPFEVFLILIIGEELFGIVGMILSVPVYTLLRIIAVQTLQGVPLIQKITSDLEKSIEKNNGNKIDT